tara:strand:- start:9171 stop:10241 length:1071 start_codon:yes stop_codon:yes gene_type:complete
VKTLRIILSTERDATPPQHSRGRHPRGLTLLELLLVVLILSMVAYSAVSLTDNLDSQFRYDDTRLKLQQIRSGVVGPTGGVVFDGQQRLSGFAPDIGRLPLTLSELAGSTVTFGVVAPVFDADPAATGLNNGGSETALSGTAETLLKGYRGPYVPLRASLTGISMFRDGWGTINASTSDDAANHGWTVTSSSGLFTVVSLGADGTAGNSGITPFDPDLTDQVTLDDWTVNLSGWQIQVRKSSGSLTNVRASLLVYVDGSWQRFTTSPAVTVDDTDPPETLTFDSSVTNWPAVGGAAVVRVPIGRALLVLVADTDAVIHNGETVLDGDAVTAGLQPVSARVSLYPRVERPTVLLVIP